LAAFSCFLPSRLPVESVARRSAAGEGPSDIPEITCTGDQVNTQS
jgi:hypothetical protein